MLRLQPTLPARYREASEETLQTWIETARERLGSDLMLLGHHYQREEVYRWADATGDSFKLAQYAAQNPDAKWIVFLGVHFMAESADILTRDDQVVVLPDLNAGCSMADMAALEEVEECWQILEDTVDINRVVPITYMNSSAAIKAFVGNNGGAVCTSSNCEAILKWAWSRGDKVLFIPDQHLGRNTARAMGRADEALWDPRRPNGGLEERTIKEAQIVLWQGHCSVHQRFTPQMVTDFRDRHPDGLVVVHPECAHEVVALADRVGSTEGIKKIIGDASPGTTWGVGTEIHLVSRMSREFASQGKSIESLDPIVCPCSTMFRIDAAHLAWCLDALVEGRTVNQISVDRRTAASARIALEKMLAIT